MKYTLFTGATGLLGAYLLRDGLLADRRLAVLVRPSRIESSRQRIESILARFEAEGGRSLPRPVVLSGDLSQPTAGLDEQSLRWVADHCDSVLHNAASLSFYHDDKTGEPERSNVEGTRRILSLCGETGIRRFHHVSTAYVCGLRSGKCLELELDVGQEFGNDYERSKVAAEKLVRGAEFLESTTFYRPAIIIGDSKTGYTSSFHGFFTPLKVASAIVQGAEAGSIDGSPILAALGFSETDEKNFVPVDWVSATIVHLLGRPEHHGRTYHLVPRNRVSIKTTTRVLEDALRRRMIDHPTERKTAEANASTILQAFREQMGVYRSYWRNDPEFDYGNTALAAPHLPCPKVDYAMLMRMSMFALESGFGWPLAAPLVPPLDIGRQFGRPSGTMMETPARASRVGLQISGRGGGQWTLYSRDGEGLCATPGLPHEDFAMIYLNSDTCQRIVQRSMTIDQAIERGDVHVEFGANAEEPLEPCVRSVLECLTSDAPPGSRGDVVRPSRVTSR
jgi:thioester reductase-like protein